MARSINFRLLCGSMRFRLIPRSAAHGTTLPCERSTGGNAEIFLIDRAEMLPVLEAEAVADLLHSQFPLASGDQILCAVDFDGVDIGGHPYPEQFFEIFEKHGIRILLRFAYSTESTPDVPYQTTKTHLSQIGKWFRENEALIKNVLFCLQTGIIGYWGEGHSYRKFKKRYIKNTIEDVCRIAPAGIYNQIRTYSMLKKVPIEYSTVVGIHDDYITGDTAHKWAFVKSTNKRRYAEVTNHARFTVNDGEMPWGRAYLNDKKILGHCDHFDGIEVLKQLKAYSLTTFSLEHNYREDEGKSYSMQKWKNVMLSYSECVEHGLTVNPELFKDKNNNSVKQSVYDIIRYHLGYHIAVKDLFITENEFFFALINYGFAPPLTFNYFAAVFEGKDGSIKEIPFENYNKNALLSGKTVSFKASVPYGCKPLGLKMETEQGSGICARFANDTEFKNGIMYFK